MSIIDLIKLWFKMTYRVILLFSKTRREKFKLEFDSIDFVMDLLNDEAEHVIIRWEYKWPRMAEEAWRNRVTQQLNELQMFSKFGFYGPDYLDDSWTFSAHKKHKHGVQA